MDLEFLINSKVFYDAKEHTIVSSESGVDDVRVIVDGDKNSKSLSFLFEHKLVSFKDKCVEEKVKSIIAELKQQNVLIEAEKNKQKEEKLKQKSTVRTQNDARVDVNLNNRNRFWDIVRGLLETKAIRNEFNQHEQRNYLNLHIEGLDNQIGLGLSIANDKPNVYVTFRTPNSLEDRNKFIRKYNEKYNVRYASANDANITNHNSYSTHVYFNKKKFYNTYEENARGLIEALERVVETLQE